MTTGKDAAAIKLITVVRISIGSHEAKQTRNLLLLSHAICLLLFDASGRQWLHDEIIASVDLTTSERSYCTRLTGRDGLLTCVQNAGITVVPY